MHGLIFLELQKFARQQAGAQAWEILLRETRLPLKSYSVVSTYPDEELLALVGAASRLLNLPATATLEAFGEFIAPELMRLYGRFLRPEWKTLDVIENTEQLIHAVVRVGNGDAKPPVLDCIRTTPDELQLLYTSERRLCSLAKGIIAGLGRYFGDTITITDEACMLRGDPFCALHIKNVTAQRAISLGADSPETGTFQERTPFSGVDAAVASATGSSFPFLKPPLQGDEIGWLADYRVLQVVGQGSMGIVFRAADMRLNRNVALKVMQPHLAADDNLRRRFMREARAMAAIKSDHVVTVYDVGSVSNLPYLAMEFLDGDSLEDYHKSVGGLPLAQVLRIGREIAQGLAAAHARGLIHRDIKPGNLWLETPTDRVKILDFGLARANTEASQLSHVGVVLGTPAFMAPEQARGMTVDHRADLFSLGCVLYWLCTNERPFKGADILSVLASLATHDPQPPESIAATVPAALSELIMQLLEKDPDRRPASSQAVADILAAIERSLVRGAGGMPLVLSS